MFPSSKLTCHSNTSSLRLVFFAAMILILFEGLLLHSLIISPISAALADSIDQPVASITLFVVNVFVLALSVSVALSANQLVYCSEWIRISYARGCIFLSYASASNVSIFDRGTCADCDLANGITVANCFYWVYWCSKTSWPQGCTRENLVTLNLMFTIVIF